MKASKAQRGESAELDVDIPGYFVDVLDEAGKPVVDAEGKRVQKPLASKVRPLAGHEEGIAVSFAIGYAKAQGVENAKRGDPHFDVGFMASIVAQSYGDPDTKPDAKGKREPTFDGGPSSVIAEHRLTIAWLYEIVEVHQGEVSPFEHQVDAGRLLEIAEKEVLANDPVNFISLAPATRWRCFHILACLFVSSRDSKSRLSGLSPETAPGPTADAETVPS